jgi:hypothetical protein
MNPAQKTLAEKLARMRAAKDAGNSTGTTANTTPDEVRQESEVQEVKEPEKQSSEVSVPAPVQTVAQVAEIPKQPAVDHPIKMQLAELEAALNQKQPEFKTILRDIHTKLRQDPAIVTLLSDEEIGGILDGLKHHAQVEIIAPKAKKTASKETKAKLANLDAGDL